MLTTIFIGMKYRDNNKDIEILEVIEKEMLLLWVDDKEIPHLLKKDEDFVKVITAAIMLERPYWSKFMVVGEA